MGAYKEQFPKGSNVRIIDRHALEQFKRDWKYHHKLQPEQLESAGKTAVVVAVGFYHGGDVLYTLSDTPGLWHECCLRAAE